MDKPTNPKDAIATDKLSLHLVSPIVKAYQAIAHYLGNVKYGAWNWRAAGARASIYKAALDRHLDAWWEGEEVDPVDGTPHLANAMACIGILIDAKHAGKLIDDRPPSHHAELAKVRSQFEALMPKIRERYAAKSPKHYTIADTDEKPLPYCNCRVACAATESPCGPVGEVKCRNLPSDHGWLPWDGKGRPVGLSTWVQVKNRAGDVSPDRGTPASAFDWSHMGVSYDIVAYRTVARLV